MLAWLPSLVFDSSEMADRLGPRRPRCSPKREVEAKAGAAPEHHLSLIDSKGLLPWNLFDSERGPGVPTLLYKTIDDGAQGRRKQLKHPSPLRRNGKRHRRHRRWVGRIRRVQNHHFPCWLGGRRIRRTVRGRNRRRGRRVAAGGPPRGALKDDSEEGDTEKKSFADGSSTSRREGLKGDSDPDSAEELRDIQWTTHVGMFRGMWIEKRYDAKEGKWKARVKRDLALPSLPASDGIVEDGDSSADELVREIARLRRKLRLQQQAEKKSDEIEQDDVEIGFPFDSIQATEPVDGRWNAARPGAFRVSGTEEDGEFHSDDSVPPPQPTLEPSTVASRRSDPVLLEANLVVDPEEGPEALLVKAEPIRRKRQGLVLLTAIIVGAILSQPDPLPTPRYRFVNVSSMQAAFNRSLPNATLDEINRASTPQAEAYFWLFASGNHPDLAETEAVPRLLHRFALASVFYSTGGNESWKTKVGWLDPMEHECLWYGVVCANGTADVFGSCKNEFGISSVSCQIRNATSIVEIDLSGNELQGSLPGEIGLLSTSKIQRIKLESNALVGAIPSEIQELTSLQVMSLIRNRLDGTVQSTIGELSNLETLFLSQNSLTGVFPVSVTNLVKLKDLDFSSNSFVVTIPSEIGRMTSLVTIALSRNALTGPIPTEISELTSLTTLDLSGTDLTVSFVDGIGKALRSLQVLALSGRKIFEGSTTIPTLIGEFVSLTRLELFSSSFSGSIPSELGQLENLEYLLCNDNELTGTIPTELGNLRNLKVWNTGNNEMMTGRIPLELARLASLEEFVVASNGHNGTVPSEFGDLSALTLLDTSYNILSGAIPSELQRLTALEELMAFGTC
jgi:Leucine-rich repeat (LRR) protein